MSEAWDSVHRQGPPLVDQMCAGWECPQCHLRREKDYGPDPCLGELPGVDFACCGHGGHPGTTMTGSGYIDFSNGKTVRFRPLWVDGLPQTGELEWK